MDYYAEKKIKDCYTDNLHYTQANGLLLQLQVSAASFS